MSNHRGHFSSKKNPKDADISELSRIDHVQGTDQGVNIYYRGRTRPIFCKGLTTAHIWELIEGKEDDV